MADETKQKNEQTMTRAKASAKPAPFLQAGPGKRKFSLTGQLMANGEIVAADTSVHLTEDEHAELLGTGAIAAPWSTNKS